MKPWIRTVILLGLPPLLHGTRSLYSALIISGTLIVSAYVLSLVNVISRRLFSESANWVCLWGVGFSLVYFFQLTLPAVFPQISDHVGRYFLLVGVTPLLYLGAAGRNSKELAADTILFLSLMVVVAGTREFFGLGSLLDYGILAAGPLEILAEPTGAFLTLGCTGLLLEMASDLLNCTNHPSPHSGTKAGGEKSDE